MSRESSHREPERRTLSLSFAIFVLACTPNRTNRALVLTLNHGLYESGNDRAKLMRPLHHLSEQPNQQDLAEGTKARCGMIQSMKLNAF